MAEAGAGAGAGEGEGEGGAAGAAGAGAGAGANGAGAGAGAGERGSGANPGSTFSYAGYIDTLRDPKLQEAGKRYNSIEDVIASNVTLRNELSDRFRAPGEKATEEDRAKFRKAIGVPDSPQGYALNLPAGVELTIDDAPLIDKLREASFKAGVPAQVFNDTILAFNEIGLAMQAEREAAAKKVHDDAQAVLDKEWGADKTAKIQLATRAANTHGGPDFVQFLNVPLADGGKLGDHPAMVRFLAGIGAKTAETDLSITSTAQEREGAMEELNRLYADPQNGVGTEGYKRPEIQRRIQELNKTIYGTAPVVGGQSRSL